MDKGLSYLTMEIAMMDFIQMVSLKGKALMLGAMGRFTRDSLKMD